MLSLNPALVVFHHYCKDRALLLQKKLEEHSIEVHNSHRPLDCLTLSLTFDLIFIGGRGIVMDYLCAKFGHFSFSRFGHLKNIMRTESHTEVDDCYSHATAA